MKAANRIERLRALMAQEELDAMVVRSITDVMWLTGFERVFDTEEAHTLVVTRDACVLHTDSRYSTALEERAADEGIWRIDSVPEGASAFLGRILPELDVASGKVAIDEMTPLALYRKYTAALREAQFQERSGDILKLRAVKEPAEIEHMRVAQGVADKAFLELMGQICPGQTEREVSLALEMAMRSNGADELAFANIVASGPNSANPHSVPGDRKLQVGDLVVIDFGARVDGYRSDTTRTICIGKPTEEQLRIYNTVKLAQEQVRHAIRPGVTGAEMQLLADQVLEEGGYGGKMGHSLGHGVGLDIHELPVLSSRNNEPLVSGNVVTDEPGIYIAGQNGVRIEDCGVVTDDGYENFCSLPHELQTVE